MALNDDQMVLLRQTFGVLKDDPERKSLYFYEELFRQDPALRGMFRDDIAGQGMRFMSTLATIVDSLDDPAELAERYADLGSGHRALGVTAAHFRTMERALIETLRHYLGDDFSFAMEDAWSAAFREISKTIIDAGHIPQD